MLGHSRSRSRQTPVEKLQASPSRKRVTRSQSRETEETRIGSNEINSAGQHDSRSLRGQSKTLPPVVEESPTRTPHKAGVRYGSEAVPESPDDAANISGTTILPSEPETDLDPEMMLEALPDLERAGKSVLDFLAPNTASPVMIVNKAKILSDPRNTQSKRLRRLMTNLDGEFRFFGNQTYIDGEGINRTLSTALAGRRGEFNDWGPDPIVQMANCARFALEVLLAGTNTNAQRQAIRSIERLFPLPFMTGLVVAGQEKAPGESSLEKETFDLALEIRKQSLILQLEENQDKPGFSPKNAVRMSFFTGLSRKSALRGFNLPNFGGAGGTLSAQYQGTVQNLYNDILLSETDDGMFDVEELRGAYLWKRFVLQAAQWIRKRTEEINTELQKRMSAQDVHDAFFTSKHPSFASTLGGSEAEASGETQEAEQETTQQQNVEQQTTVASELQQQQPESAAVQRDTERRQSSKPLYLNSLSIQRIKQRQERLRSGSETSEHRRQSDIVHPFSQAVNEESAADRRKTLSALPSSRPAPQAARREVHLSFNDASPALLPDEPDITVGDDSQLAIGNESTQIERSHSPPTIRRSIAPWRREAPSPSQRTDGMTLSQRVWEAAKTAKSAQPAPGPSRSAAARFIDRQEHAARVSPIRDSDSQGAVKRVEDRASRKRGRSPSSGSESDDAGDIFDYDSRPVDLERRRAEKPQQSRNKRPRLEEPESKDTNAGANEDDEDESPRPVIRRSHPASINSQPSAKERAPTPRVRWTEEEDNRLLRLIRDHGPHWALILRQNQAQPPREGEVRFQDRGQGALKDRARNIKIAHYRDGLEMPKNLEHVTMSKKDYERLEARGIVVPRR
ncbi:hypothetical protein BDW62DRAFT_21028 [Aspergillus aurantiobrunneus]